MSEKIKNVRKPPTKETKTSWEKEFMGLFFDNEDGLMRCKMCMELEYSLKERCNNFSTAFIQIIVKVPSRIILALLRKNHAKHMQWQ